MSSIFFNYFTCIDHAVIDNQGLIVGGSFHPILEVTGKIDETEQVVVDFSTGKKDFKAVIDDKTTGLDHKLIIIPGYSKCLTKNYSDTHIEIETNYNRVIIPKTDVHIVNANFDTTIARTLGKELQRMLETKFEHLQFNVFLSQTPFALTQKPMLFRYTHGLKNSTSYGCKNIAHGHLSFFEIIEHYPDYREDCQDCKTGMRLISETLASLKNVVLVNNENVVTDTQEKIILEYDTDRGSMRHEINPNIQPIFRMNCETTIENVGEFLSKYMLNYLLLAKVKKFRISEGLQKGAVIEVSSIHDIGNVLSI